MKTAFADVAEAKRAMLLIINELESHRQELKALVAAAPNEQVVLASAPPKVNEWIKKPKAEAGFAEGPAGASSLHCVACPAACPCLASHRRFAHGATQGSLCSSKLSTDNARRRAARRSRRVRACAPTCARAACVPSHRPPVDSVR